MSLQERFEKYKNKKELIAEINLYRSIISKKRINQDYNSALEKLKSVLILLNEYEDYYDLYQERIELENLNNEIKSELGSFRSKFLKRYNSLLKEDLTKDNLENFSKLLAMLKVEIDKNMDKFNLHDIHTEINKYFKYIKNIYTILSSYKVLNYYTASKQILRFASEIKNENFPNIKKITLSLYQELLSLKLSEISEKYDKIKISELSHILAIDSQNLVEFVHILMKQQMAPIKNYIPKTQEIVFNKKINAL
jgi:hypothetical protein